jgi:type 1 glutamine amidotransferase
MNTPPMSAEECPVPGKTPFKGKGIRVGVVVGGYGSEGILETLRKAGGIDAVPVATGRLLADQCQVIILPQMRGNPPPDKAVKALESYVTKGGGLITTHDAVGYRSMPKILPKICAGGKEHVRHERWQIADGKHPLANGLPAGQALSQAYFDHIQLTPGPDGTTVAVSEKTKQPVVVAGTTGKGRYVACGLLVGTDAEAEEAPATGPEATLLLNAIRWCASGGK